MSYIPEGDRYQSRIMCLDDMVAAGSMARVVDKFVEVCDLEELGFTHVDSNEPGRPSYSPLTMTKIYLYCYEEGIRSSRMIEKACRTNIEVMWLAGGLTPVQKTIAAFRHDNVEAFTALFSEFTSFLDSCGLFGKTLVAIDGTKIRASNSKKRNVSRRSAERKIKHHTAKAEEYLKALDKADGTEEIEELSDKVDEARKRAEEAEGLLEKMDEAGVNEISLTDSDARCMGKGRQGMHVSYNVQTSVDGKCHLIADFLVTNQPNDMNLLSPMAIRYQEIMRKCGAVTVADKGYYSGDDLEICRESGINCIVAPQGKTDGRHTEGYGSGAFKYDEQADTYTCPHGAKLTCKSKPDTRVKLYSNKEACLSCEAQEQCRSSRLSYRKIRRQPKSEILEWADERYFANTETYSQRQQLVEHPFGTVKHTMKGDHFLLRGIDKVKCEAALLFAGYNLKRALNELGFEKIMAKMDEYGALVKAHNSSHQLITTLYMRIYVVIKGARSVLAVFFPAKPGSVDALAV